MKQLKDCGGKSWVFFRKIENNDTIAYGGYDTNTETLQRSSSGGFFGVLAEEVLAEGDTVYRVVFSDDFRSVYYSSTNEEPIDRMRGSKYGTTRKKGIYNRVREQLKTGRTILFVDLPCEIAARYSVLKTNYENLLTCELICAGLSSYNLLEVQLDWLQEKYKSETADFSFRLKKYGWVPYSIY